MVVLAAAGTAVAVPAHAEPAPSVLGGAAKLGAGDITVGRDKLPKGARRATKGALRTGSYGAAFQKKVSTTDGSTRVVGGVLTNASEHPGVVGIRIFFWFDVDGNGSLDEMEAICTGTVISPTKVLTAGHCNVDWPFATTQVIAGRNDLTNETAGYVADVQTTWTHQSFNYVDSVIEGTQVPRDDVAVLTLKQPLPAAYTPVTLSAQGDQSPYAAGTEALIVGYGYDENGVAGLLRKATVPFQGNATCSATFGTSYDAARMACAGSPGVDSCNGDSGGPILVGGVQVGITDWGPEECGSSYGVYERLSYYRNVIAEDLTRPSLINLDWAGDGHSDLFARYSDGTLYEFSGAGFVNNGYGGFSGLREHGTGWNRFTKLFRTYNWTGNRTPQIMARDSSGRLFMYALGAKGGIGASTQIGSGWNSFTDIMVTNNWIGNGLPNLMGRTASGDLMLYNSDGKGGWLNPRGTKIGTGWNSFDTILTPGAWQGDGYQTLIGRTSNGNLIMYKSDGQGGWQNPRGTKIGSGWNGFRIFMSPGDWNGDNMIDLIGINPAGGVFLYTTNGRGAWLNARGIQIDSGWQFFTAVF